MAILFDAEDVKLPSLKKRIVSKWIKDVASSYDKKIGEVSYLFCSDEKILEINNQYLQHDYFTDIITFDYTEGDIINGDLFISLDTVRSNSEKFKTLYEDELYRVIIHGILHLCGINDKAEGEQKFMTECENKALLLLTKLIE